MEQQGERACSGGVMTGAEGTKEEPEKDPPWGWLVTAATFMLMFLAITPSTSFGILFSAFLLELGTSSTATSWILNLSFVISCVVTFLLGPVVDQLGWRKVTLVSGILFSLGMLLSAFATSAEFLILSFSVIAGCNTEFLITICYLVVPHYMVRWRTIANALMTTGICISQMVMPPLITYLQEQYGFKGATLITGALTLNCCVAAMVLHPVEWHRTGSAGKDVPSNTDFQPSECCFRTVAKKTKFCLDGNYSKECHVPIIVKKDELKSPTNSLAASGKQISVKNSFLLVESLKTILMIARQNIQLLKSSSVFITSFVFAANIVVNFNVLSLVPFAMLDAGYSQQDSAFCLTVFGLCNFTTRILTTLLTWCPRITARTWYLLGTSLSAVGMAGFPFGDTVYMRAATLGLCGAGYGIPASIYSLIIVDEFGLPMLLPILTIVALMSGFQFLVVGPLAGVSRDVSGSYVVSFCLFAAFLAVSIVLGLIKPSTHNKQQQQQQQQRKRDHGHSQEHEQQLSKGQLPHHTQQQPFIKINELQLQQHLGKVQGEAEKEHDQSAFVKSGSETNPLLLQLKNRPLKYNAIPNTNAKGK